MNFFENKESLVELLIGLANYKLEDHYAFFEYFATMHETGAAAGDCKYKNAVEFAARNPGFAYNAYKAYLDKEEK